MQDVPTVRSISGATLQTVVLLVVCALGVGYMASRVKVGWVPHDEGTLGLSAERVWQGQLPHRDFDDYTGGLTFVHALAFRTFGVSSAAMRYVLFAFFVLWVPAVFYIASRFSSAIVAGAVTLVCVAWSAPNYPGSMPSWYNLFFATWGVAALLRYLESESMWWLFVAGLCGGLSILAKIAAAYYTAGVLLFFVFRVQSVSAERNAKSGSHARIYPLAVTLALGIFLLLLFRMIRAVTGISDPIYFVLPTLAVAIFLVVREFGGTEGSDSSRFASLARMCLPFGAGVAIPLFLFAIPYFAGRGGV